MKYWRLVLWNKEINQIAIVNFALLINITASRSITIPTKKEARSEKWITHETNVSLTYPASRTGTSLDHPGLCDDHSWMSTVSLTILGLTVPWLTVARGWLTVARLRLAIGRGWRVGRVRTSVLATLSIRHLHSRIDGWCKSCQMF